MLTNSPASRHLQRGAIAFTAITLALGSTAVGSSDTPEVEPDSVPTAVPVDDTASGDPVTIPVGANVGVWGLDDDGERFDYTYVQSESSPPAGATLAEPIVAGAELVDAEMMQTASASSTDEAQETVPFDAVQQAAAVCSVFISDVDFQIPDGFRWETSQTCSGAFGDQRHRTQMWRSSWSGPRGYANWTAWTGWTAGNFVDRRWILGCGGGGTYDYYPVVQGDSSVIGRSPKVRADNQETVQCGTSPS